MHPASPPCGQVACRKCSRWHHTCSSPFSAHSWDILGALSVGSWIPITNQLWVQSHIAMCMCQSINTVSSILYTCVCICICHQVHPLSCLSLFYQSFYTLDRFMVLFQLFNPLPHQPLGRYMPPCSWDAGLDTNSPFQHMVNHDPESYIRYWQCLLLFYPRIPTVSRKNEWQLSSLVPNLSLSCPKLVGNQVRLDDKKTLNAWKKN